MYNVHHSKVSLSARLYPIFATGVAFRDSVTQRNGKDTADDYAMAQIDLQKKRMNVQFFQVQISKK